MDIKERYSNEDFVDTIKYIDSKRNWDIDTQTYKVTNTSSINIEDCNIYWRGKQRPHGKLLVIEHQGIVHFWEYGTNSYFHQAIELFDPEMTAKWKTLDKLIALRQAIRECLANGWGYTDMLHEGKMTLRLYDAFMKLARRHDFLHHGQHTF